MFALYQEMKTDSRVPLVSALSEIEAVALGKMLSYLHAAPVVACDEDADSSAPALRFMAGQIMSRGQVLPRRA